MKSNEIKDDMMEVIANAGAKGREINELLQPLPSMFADYRLAKFEEDEHEQCS